MARQILIDTPADWAAGTGVRVDASTVPGSLRLARFADAMFSRPSLAWLDGVEYPPDAPRFLPGGGVMTEEGTTNLLTANQASVETDTAGLQGVWSSTIARDTSTSKHGVASLRVTAAGGTGRIGFDTGGQMVSATAGQTFTASVYVKGTGNTVGRQFRIDLRENGTGSPYSSTVFTMTGDWQRVTVTRTITQADTTGIRLVVNDAGPGAVDGDVFWADMLQIEQKPYATSWHLPGSSRARESLTLPNSGLTPAAGTIEVDVEINAMARRQVAGQYPEIFNIRGGVQTQGILFYHSPISAYWSLKTMADDGTFTQVNFADSLLPDGLRVLRCTWDGKVKVVQLYVDDNPTPVATITDAKLPSAFGDIALGGRSDTTMLNSAIYAARLDSVIRGAAERTGPDVPLADDDYVLGLWVFDHRITGNYRSSGTWTRRFDLGSTTIGSFRDLSLTGTGTSSVSVRSRSSYGGAEWSAWYPGLGCPTGRFVELELTLSALASGADTPVIDSAQFWADAPRYDFVPDRAQPIELALLFSTTITRARSGRERRLSNWNSNRRAYNLVHRRSMADLQSIAAFIRAVGGSRDGFDWVDPLDGVTKRFRFADDQLRSRLWPALSHGELDVALISLPLGEDTTPPAVSSVAPPLGGTSNGLLAPVAWTFTEAVRPEDVSSTYFHVVDSTTGAHVPGVLRQSVNGRVVTFTPASDSPYIEGRMYFAPVEAGVHDLANNRMASRFNTRFTATAV